ncbi:MAG: hypothetical protein ABSC61_07440 [Anaerolineales bacterium]
MDKTVKKPIAIIHPNGLERFDTAIVILALILYIAERYAIFAHLLNQINPVCGFESQILGFLFGRPPYTFLNIFLGFNSSQGLFGIILPINFLPVVLQTGHFLLNYLMVRFLFLLIIGLIQRKSINKTIDEQ